MPIITNDLGFAIVLAGDVALAIALLSSLGVQAWHKRRRRAAEDEAARWRNHARRPWSRPPAPAGDLDQHWATTPRDEHPTVVAGPPVNAAHAAKRRRDWRDVS